MTRKGKNPLLLLGLLGAVLLLSIGAYSYSNGVMNAMKGDDRFEAGDTAEIGTKKKPLPTVFCPLDGAGLEEMPQYRPVAVMIDNLPAARPQSGLAQADVVYEMLVEGGITRIMAVFYHGSADKVGPIRSVRPYFIEQALGFNAVIVHMGGSPEAMDMLDSEKIAHINEYGINRGFWRDSKRKAPHNLYSSCDNLHRLTQEMGYNKKVHVPGLPFRLNLVEGDDNRELQSQEIEIFYPLKSSRVKYEYIEKEDAYRRFVGGEEHVDARTGQALTPRNIIVQIAKTRVIDGQGRLDIEIVGRGQALVFSGGSVIEAVWKKADPQSPTIYEAADGTELYLRPGQTWIQVVTDNTVLVF